MRNLLSKVAEECGAWLAAAAFILAVFYVFKTLYEAILF